MSSLDCTYQELKTRARQFHDALPTLNIEELDSAWKMFGLSYLNMSEPMWLHSAAALLKMMGREYSARETELLAMETI
jgi:hypothetical protein